jgi:drug/metabolite transporter (DMT)-like permease
VSRRAWLLFAAVSLLWGVPYLLIKVILDEVEPSVLVVGRTGLAALLLVPLAWRRGVLGQLRGRMITIAVLAGVQVVGPFMLIALGEERVSSSLTGLLIAAQPIWVALIALFADASERSGGWRLVGLACGLGGIVVLLGLDIGGDVTELVGALMVLGASLGYAVAALLIRWRLRDVSPFASVSSTLVVATAVLLPLAAVHAPSRVPSAGTLAAMVVLGLVCTAVGMVCFYALIAEAGARNASVINYTATAITVVLGIAILDEAFGAATAAGFALVVAGSWLATGGRPTSLWPDRARLCSLPGLSRVRPRGESPAEREEVLRGE